jgi:hypothetical protein
MNLDYDDLRPFPTLLCVDDFYENPDEIREFAISQDFDNTKDHCPGSRTKPLNELNNNLFDSFCNRLFSLYFDYRYCNIEWFVYTCFQKIDPFDDDINSPLNRGWVHSDKNYIGAGVIYLNKFSLPDSGTSFYKLKPNIKKEFNYKIRDSFYENRNECDVNEYLNYHEENENSFDKTLTVGNVYNRMIFYDSNYFHRENNFVSGFDEPRLTQVFFIKEIKTDTVPIERMSNYEIKF